MLSASPSLFGAMYAALNAVGSVQSAGFSHRAVATVTTDRQDYLPGQRAILKGHGFAPNEHVRVQVLHIDGTPNAAPEHQPWVVRADSTGSIRTGYPVGADDLNTTLQVTATGLRSHRIATHVFTDTQTGTTTVVTTSASTITFGQPVTFTATVSGGATPAGNVTFYDGSTSIGTAALSAGRAGLTTSALRGGSRSISATYGGDSSHRGSTSAAITQTVARAATTTTVTSTAGASSGGPVLRPDHVVVVVEEDRGDAAIGDVAHMPYINQLASTGLVYSNSHGIGHPSLPNYLALYSGSTQGKTDNGNYYTFTAPNIANSMNSTLVNGQYLSFVGYAETLPHDGDMTTRLASDPNDPTSPPDLYMRNYNPMAQFTNVGQQGSTAVGYAQVNKTFASFPTSATAYSNLPNVAYVIPNNLHNTHGSNEQSPYATDPTKYDFLRTSADTWLHDKLDGYVQWAKTHNSLLILTTDEEETDTHPTSTITTIVTGDPRLFVAGTNANNVTHYNVLRTMEDMYGISPIAQTTSVGHLDTDSLGRLSPPPSGGPVQVGQAVTFTATVAPTAANSTKPTGTVQFQVDGVNYGSAVALVNGVATSQATSTLSAGSHAVTAVYSADTNYAASTSPTYTQTVGQVATTSTTTALAASVNPAVVGQNVTLTATVDTGGSGTAGGTVTFKDGSNVLGTATLNSAGAAAFTVSSLGVGTHSLTAAYGGNSSFSASTSSALSETINRASTATSLASSAGSAVFGQAVTFTATVSAVASGAGIPTGSVTFSDGGSAMGSAALNASGIATFTIASFAVGSHTITASYGSDGKFVASTSGSLTQSVAQASTTTVVGGPSSAATGQAVSFTATVSAVAPGTGTPSGSVQFRIDGVNFGNPAPLVGGSAGSDSTTTLADGGHTISAVYSADGNFSASSGSRALQVGAPALAASATALVSSANPSTFGQSVTFTATVTSASGTPTGTVTFSDGGITFGTSALNASGVATFSTTAMQVASHSIAASYSGNAAFAASASSTLGQTVNKAATTTTIASSANPASVGQSVSFTATVTSAAGTPTGTVQFVIDGTNFGSAVALSGGKATSAAITTLASGNHTISAAYSGAASFAAGASAAFTQTVGTTNNNNFANAIAISGTTATVTGSNVGATKETGEPNHAGNAGGKSVWWNWTAPSNGMMTIDTLSSTFDTLQAVYTGTSVSALTAVASNDDSPAGGTSTSKLTFAATAGVTYQIAVDGYGGASGSITMHLSLSTSAPAAPTGLAAGDGVDPDKIHLAWTASAGAAGYEVWRNTTNDSSTAVKISAADVTATNYDDTTSVYGTTYWYWVKSKNANGTSAFSAGDSGYRAPSATTNDNFANAITITGSSATVTGSNAGATKEVGEPNHAGNVGGHSVWWTWTAPTSGTVTIDTLGSNFDTLMGVYTGSSVSALTVKASNDDSAAGGTTTSKVTLAVTAGTAYQIAVDGYGGVVGSITLHLNLV